MTNEKTKKTPSAETVIVEDRVIACDGGKGRLGHPKVYLNMGANNSISCPYCSKEFVLKG